MAGKWHVTKQTGYWSGNEQRTSRHNWPLQRGFDRFWGTIHGAGSYWNPVSLTDGNAPVSIPDGEPFYYTDAISDHAARFVREHHGDGPLLLYIAYTAPHWPLHAPEEDIRRYEHRYDDGWDALRDERYRRMIDLGLIDSSWAMSPRDRGVPAWSEAPHRDWQRRAMAVYAAMIDRMDQGIGRVIEALEDTGRLDRTIIFFLADNGGCAEGGTAFGKEGRTSGLSCAMKVTRDGRLVHFGHYEQHMPGPADTYQEYGKPWANASNTPFRLYKHWVHEGGIASPLIVHWPAGIEARGELRDEPGHVIDLMPTCLELAGAAYPESREDRPIEPVAGVSLTPTFEGRSLDREAIYWEHEGNRAVRAGRWKLAARGRRGPWELYDMTADRTELHDLAADHPDVVERLAGMWQAWAERSQVIPWPK
jgi:arylsulfatase